MKETYLGPVVSWMPVHITHTCVAGVNRSRTISKVPRAVHRIRSGRNQDVHGHRFIDESVLREGVQGGVRQHVLHQDVLGDVLSMQCIEGPQVDSKQTCFFWCVEHLGGWDSVRPITIFAAQQSFMIPDI